tara:strand:+ start:2636 stop:3064 length:429 start_codon:yes stop_codon:yes gene_type:complete
MPVKKQTSAKLRKKALVLAQKLARLEGADDNGYCSCVTCQKFDHYKNMDGGHFISKGSSSRWSLDTRNIWPQCKGCNGFGMKDGTAQISYTIYMQEKFGVDFVEEMLASKKDVYKISTPDYRDLISDLQSRINVELARIGET